jgi:hypothetical protein
MLQIAHKFPENPRLLRVVYAGMVLQSKSRRKNASPRQVADLDRRILLDSQAVDWVPPRWGNFI